jgi:hypothetical protein
MCSSERRADEQDVIFKRKDEMLESLKTALGNLPLALERFQHYKKKQPTYTMTEQSIITVEML